MGGRITKSLLDKMGIPFLCPSLIPCIGVSTSFSGTPVRAIGCDVPYFFIVPACFTCLNRERGARLLLREAKLNASALGRTSPNITIIGSRPLPVATFPTNTFPTSVGDLHSDTGCLGSVYNHPIHHKYLTTETCPTTFIPPVFQGQLVNDRTPVQFSHPPFNSLQRGYSHPKIPPLFFKKQSQLSPFFQFCENPHI